MFIIFLILDILRPSGETYSSNLPLSNTCILYPRHSTTAHPLLVILSLVASTADTTIAPTSFPQSSLVVFLLLASSLAVSPFPASPSAW